MLLIVGVFVFIAFDETQRDLQSSPEIVDGTLDFAQAEGSWQGQVALDGEWEFFWKQWIVSEAAADGEFPEPDCMMPVPAGWAGVEIGDEILGEEGWASYRLHVRNCSVNQLVAYLPDYNSSYRVFVDGRQLAFHGELSKDPSEVSMRTTVLYLDASPESAQDFDIVIEVASDFAGGLYKAPVLQTMRDVYVHSSIILYVQAGCLGIILMSVFLLLIIRLFRDSDFDTMLLMVLSILLFVLVFSHSQIAHLKMFDLISKYYTPLWLFMMSAFALVPFVLYLACLRLLRQRPKSSLRLAFAAFAVAVIALSFVFSGEPTPTRAFALAAACSATTMAAGIALVGRCWRSWNWEAFVLGTASQVLAAALFLNAWYWRGFGYLNISLLIGLACVGYLAIILCIYIRRKSIMQRQELSLREARVKLRDAEVQLMISQIQPHFVYNTLTAVLALIDTDPQKASDLLLKFTKYLRTNIDSLKGTDMIVFDQELRHVQTYLEIEQVRLGVRLSTSIDCKATNFLVPQLCVQPFVENAVKHGIAKRPEGGSVSISSWESEDSFVIRVSDDGVGFDVSSLSSDERGSVGIANVIYRLEELMGAQVEIESTVGNGTTITMLFPKEYGASNGSQANSGKSLVEKGGMA